MPPPSPNDPDLSPPPHLHPSHQPFGPENPSPPALPKKKHVCQVCKRAFTTSGHLARHARIHTGERNHKCPFPGCETRCSRQDNLQQHYRIHLSPGSRRNSGSATRAAMNRATVSDRSRSSRRRSKNPSESPLSPSPPAPIPSPPLEPPPLVPAYPAIPSAFPEPPDTPPPLAPAYPTLPPPTAPVYPQQSLSGRASSRSSRSTPDAAYHSPVSYVHPSLSAPSYAQYHPDDTPYPPSSQGSRSSSSFGRPGEDARWAYHPQGEQHYPASESDRFSPVSPANPNGHYPEPVSPVESLNNHQRTHSHAHGHVQLHQDSASYFTHHPHTALRQNQPNAAVPTSASPVSFSQSQLPPTSHRHSIAHISNPIRQHSPTSTNSASPVVSTPPTPGYAYVQHSMSGYNESPPESLSPVTSAPPPHHAHAPSVMPVFNSYESSSLASAGYSHPPSAHPQMQQQQQQMYDRTLPALTPAHTRDPQSQTALSTHFSYAQPSSYQHQAAVGTSAPDRYSSPRPVLAPIHDSRAVRGDGGGGGGVRYASPQPPSYPPAHGAPPHQQTQLANIGRPPVASTAHHTFAYPSSSQSQAQVQAQAQSQSPHDECSYTHTPAYPHSSQSHASASVSSSSMHGHNNAHAQAASATASSSAAEYYYQAVPAHMQGHAHGHHREASPDGMETGAEVDVDVDADAYLELHQPQPQRALPPHTHAHTGHHYIQTSAVMTHPVWRADDYRGRLVQ